MSIETLCRSLKNVNEQLGKSKTILEKAVEHKNIVSYFFKRYFITLITFGIITDTMVEDRPWPLPHTSNAPMHSIGLK